MTPSSHLRRRALHVLRAAGPALLGIALLGIGLAPAQALAQTQTQGDPAEDFQRLLVERSLRARLERAQADPAALEVGGRMLAATTALPAFYERRLFRPAWLAGGGLSPAGRELAAALRETPRHGLAAEDYRLGEIEALLGRLRPGLGAGVRADLDLLLTDAFLVHGAHLVSGRVDPESFDPEWIAVRREVDLVQALERALERGRVAAALAELLPVHPGYGRLAAALERYRGLAAAGGWGGIEPGLALKEGESHPVIPALRARLLATGDLAPAAGEGEGETETDLYGADLAAAVRRFQARHGLDADGVVGEKSRAALAVSAEQRVRQIELNLERWRWLPQELGERHVLVNIPDYRLRVVEGGATTLELRAIVGKRFRATPVFSDTLRYLVLNPSWEVPYKLAVEDKLPEIRKDPAYLARLGFRVFAGWGGDQQEIDPASVDWAQLSRKAFPYRLRQEPGPQNALGRVKFMFPNKFNVYLHDTPSRELFAKAQRDLSSGCIRVDQAVDLAEHLLAGQLGWNRPALDAALAAGEEKMVPLARPLAVHLLYWTAWAAEDGTVHFREDLYGRDARLSEALAISRAESLGAHSSETPP